MQGATHEMFVKCSPLAFTRALMRRSHYWSIVWSMTTCCIPDHIVSQSNAASAHPCPPLSTRRIHALHSISTVLRSELSQSHTFSGIKFRVKAKGKHLTTDLLLCYAIVNWIW